MSFDAQNLVGPCRCDFRDPTIRADSTAAVVKQNDLVLISDSADFSTIRFRGWVKQINPNDLSVEGVAYRAFDMRYRLEREIPAMRNGGYAWQYNRDGNPNATAPGYGWYNFWTVGQALHDVLEHAFDVPSGAMPNAGSGSNIPEHHTSTVDVNNTYLTSSDVTDYDKETIDDMDRELITFDVSGSCLGQVFTLLCQEQTEHAWYIHADSAALVIVDISASTPVNINAGELGHHVDESGKSYNLQSCKLTFSLDGVYSKVTVQGKDKVLFCRPKDIVYPVVSNTPGQYWTVSDTESALEKGWDPWLEQFWDYDTAKYGGYNGDDAMEWVWKRYIVHTEDHWPWRPGIAGDAGWNFNCGHLFYANEQGKKLGWGGGSYIIYFDKGAIKFWSALPPGWHKNLYCWMAYYSPFVVSVGHSGSAYSNYGHKAELVLVNENFEHGNSRWPDNSTYGGGYGGQEAHDDTARMTQIATRIHAALSSEIASAELAINPIDLDTYTVHKKVNLKNLDKWGGIGLQIFHIRVDCERETMTLACANRVDGVSMDGIKEFEYWIGIYKRQQDAAHQRRRLLGPPGEASYETMEGS